MSIIHLNVLVIFKYVTDSVAQFSHVMFKYVTDSVT